MGGETGSSPSTVPTVPEFDHEAYLADIREKIARHGHAVQQVALGRIGVRVAEVHGVELQQTLLLRRRRRRRRGDGVLGVHHVGVPVDGGLGGEGHAQQHADALHRTLEDLSLIHI